MVFNTIGKMLTWLDIFGHKISINYKGEEAYQTRIGGLLTVATYAFIVVNTAKLLTSYTDFSDQKESV